MSLSLVLTTLNYCHVFARLLNDLVIAQDNVFQSKIADQSTVRRIRVEKILQWIRILFDRFSDWIEIIVYATCKRNKFAVVNMVVCVRVIQIYPPIRNTIFNFNKLVTDLDIYTNTPKF